VDLKIVTKEEGLWLQILRRKYFQSKERDTLEALAIMSCYMKGIHLVPHNSHMVRLNTQITSLENRTKHFSCENKNQDKVELHVRIKINARR
jgi:hypothetical protein